MCCVINKSGSQVVLLHLINVYEDTILCRDPALSADKEPLVILVVVMRTDSTVITEQVLNQVSSGHVSAYYY